MIFIFGRLHQNYNFITLEILTVKSNTGSLGGFGVLDFVFLTGFGVVVMIKSVETEAFRS
jgi:hypothetical protein